MPSNFVIDMHKSVYEYLAKYSDTTNLVDKLIMSLFYEFNGIQPRNNRLLLDHYIGEQDDGERNKLEHLIGLVKKERKTLTVEDLIQLFEFVISPADKEVNGAVYTPNQIREYIVTDAMNRLEASGRDLNHAKFGDIACGCGGFFFTITQQLRARTGRSFKEVFRDNIFGLDIEDYSIKRTKLLLSALALQNGEDEENYTWNLFVGDALKFKWSGSCDKIRSNKGFDAIVGNPPYVGAVKLDAQTKAELKKWEVARVGKADLYIPFFQIGLELLVENGVLGFISVNSFYKSLNGIGLRSYISQKLYDFRIIDFGGEQVFKGRTTYTCICILQNRQSDQIEYIKIKSRKLSQLGDRHFVSILYDGLDNRNGWLLDEAKIAGLVLKIETIGKQLGDCFDIRNGFATLRNGIYLINANREDGRYFYVQIEEREFRVEKKICKLAIKPNILKSEEDIQEKLEYLLFPYHLTYPKGTLFPETPNPVLSLFKENYFQENFPYAYEYLLFHKKELAKRDNGNKEYENWFAFGRNQALNFRGKKLLFPYISDHPYFVYTDNEELLFYNGFAVISHNEEDLRVVQKVLNSRLFWFYLSNVSRPYENDYYSMGKRYLKRFGVFQFSAEERHELLSMVDQNLINEYLESKYEIILPNSYVNNFKESAEEIAIE